MTTTPVATAATSQPEWARCRGRGEQSLHCAFVAGFLSLAAARLGKSGLSTVGFPTSSKRMLRCC